MAPVYPSLLALEQFSRMIQVPLEWLIGDAPNYGFLVKFKDGCCVAGGLENHGYYSGYTRELAALSLIEAFSGNILRLIEPGGNYRDLRVPTADELLGTVPPEFSSDILAWLDRSTCVLCGREAPVLGFYLGTGRGKHNLTAQLCEGCAVRVSREILLAVGMKPWGMKP